VFTPRYVLPTQCICVFITEAVCVYCAVPSAEAVFSVDLRTNSDYFTVQH
jgi:hypothetical protein